MRIGFDIDDVLYPWYVTAHGLCEAAGITNGNEPTSWAPYEQYGCTDQQWFDALAVGTLDGSLYSVPPIEGVVDDLFRLREAGHSIHLVTARGFLRHGELIRQQTVTWLRQWDIPHDSLTFSKDKRVANVDVFIDDAAHNYDQLIGTTAVWLLHAPHNGPERDGRFTMATVGEFVDMVLALSGEPS